MTPESATPGSSITVVGASLDDPCVGTPAVGSVGPSIRLYLVQGSTDVSLALIEASKDGAFSIEVGVPDSVVPGPAQVVIRRANQPAGAVVSSADLTISAS